MGLIEKEKWDINSEEGAQSSIVTKKIAIQGQPRFWCGVQFDNQDFDMESEQAIYHIYFLFAIMCISCY